VNTEDVGNCCIRVYIYLQKKTLVLILKLLSVILSKLSIYSVKLRIPNNLLFLLYNFCFLKQNINTPLSCKILLKLVIKPWLPTHSPRAFFCPLSLLKMPFRCFYEFTSFRSKLFTNKYDSFQWGKASFPG
jgi:hypothetical protein